MDDAGERFFAATLLSRENAGGGLTRVVVAPHPRLAPSFTTPGQYVEMRVGGATGFFAIASEPGATPWELVMRAGGGASDVVLELPPGAPLELTGALGEGFPVHEAGGAPLVVALAGTGVAAAPPILSWRIRHDDAARTRVLLGVRVADEIPLPDALPSWAEAGVGVVVCVSQGELPPPRAGVRFAAGRVQDVLRAERDSVAQLGLPPRWVFAVGPLSLVDALRASARELGVDHVVTNH